MLAVERQRQSISECCVSRGYTVRPEEEEEEEQEEKGRKRGGKSGGEEWEERERFE